MVHDKMYTLPCVTGNTVNRSREVEEESRDPHKTITSIISVTRDGEEMGLEWEK